MDTKQKGDIAEQVAVVEALKRGWGVCVPIGDRLPYDIVFDVEGTLVRVQVKSAWFEERSKNYVVETRRHKTNRRQMIVDTYKENDFDFALLYVQDIDVFYVMPIDVFLSYKGAISLVEEKKRQRKPKSSPYRDAWHLISDN